jgi:hypothetical protein
MTNNYRNKLIPELRNKEQNGVIIPPEFQEAFESIKDKPIVYGKWFEIKFPTKEEAAK